MMRAARAVVVVTVVATALAWAAPAPASAAGPGGILCTLTGLVSGVLGKVCTLATHAGKVVGAGENLVSGHLGRAIGTLTGTGAPQAQTVGRAATATIALAAIATAVAGGAQFLLRETANVIGSTTRPDLTSTWFSSAYWRMAAISALLTLPFVFAAAVQALIRSDLNLLARAAFGSLPLAMLAVGVAAPLTALLLSGSDEMSSLVAAASGHAGAGFLVRAGGLGGFVSLLGRNLFVLFFIALLTAAATVALWAELLVRDAAVYVIVLMLPLFFAAMVWPARRIWATRAVELLIALILSKFVIVAVLTLGGAALDHSTFPGAAAVLSGVTLVMLAALSPWALLRLLPLQELAGAAAGGLRGGGLGTVPDRFRDADALADRNEPPPQPEDGRRLETTAEAHAADEARAPADEAAMPQPGPAPEPGPPPPGELGPPRTDADPPAHPPGDQDPPPPSDSPEQPE